MSEFNAKIDKIGINPVVDPPDEILGMIFAAAGKNKGSIRVRGTINGTEFLQTLVRFRGKWRLYINGNMLLSSGAAVGETVRVQLEYDPEPRPDVEPARLRLALDADPTARAAFESLSPSRRRDIIRYLGSLKTDEAVKRNIENVMKQLTSTS